MCCAGGDVVETYIPGEATHVISNAGYERTLECIGRHFELSVRASHEKGERNVVRWLCAVSRILTQWSATAAGSGAPFFAVGSSVAEAGKAAVGTGVCHLQARGRECNAGKGRGGSQDGGRSGPQGEVTPLGDHDARARKLNGIARKWRWVIQCASGPVA